MDEEKILFFMENSLAFFKIEHASKLANIVNELDKLTYNDAMLLLKNAKLVLENSKISLT